MEENFSMLTADNIIWLKRGHGTYVDGEYLRIEDTRSPLYKKFYYSGFMAVSYSPEHIYKPSIIHFSRNYIIIDTLGNNLAPEFVSFAGDWYDRRVADLLPMEYIPDN